jgi:hypothetical protein
MSGDWGFYYTSTSNLRKIKEAMVRVSVLNDQHRVAVTENADKLLQFIEETPKSFSWKMRSRTGTSKPWYNEVSDWA